MTRIRTWSGADYVLEVQNRPDGDNLAYVYAVNDGETEIIGEINLTGTEAQREKLIVLIAAALKART